MNSACKDTDRRKSWRLILLVLITLVLKSCMQWEPTDPKQFFGSWHLEKRYVNGEFDESYNQDLMINFAGQVFNFAYMERAEIYGSWEYSEGVLTLNASYHAGSGAQIDYLFDPFPVGMMFPTGKEIVSVDVTQLTDTKMQWNYIDKNDRDIIVEFKKYP